MIEASVFQRILERYPVLRGMSPTDQALLRADMQRVSAPTGQVLFDLDSPCSLFLLLYAGGLRVIKPAVSGREIVLYRLAPGDSCILTVSCLLGHTSYPARGVVESDLIAYAISQPMFSRLLAESGPFRTFVFHHFAERIADLMQLVEEVAFGQMDQRLAALLASRGPVIEATHQQLADELGTVREVVSRRLKQLEQGGLVRLERGQVVVVNGQGLRELAGALHSEGH